MGGPFPHIKIASSKQKYRDKTKLCLDNRSDTYINESLIQKV